MTNKSTPGENHRLPWWKGTISGVLSVTLGLLALCGVACFRFPEYLTSEEFRSTYSTAFARGLMFWSLVAAYTMGIVSYVLSDSKKLAWCGILSAFAASLLGGSRVEIRPFESTPYGFGLDWFVVSFLFSMVIFIPIERAFAQNQQPILRRGWRTDLAYFIVSHLLIQFIFLFVNAFSETLFGWAVHDGFQAWIQSWPIVVQFVAATFLADFFQYWTHRSHHLVPWLWKFHAVHHSSNHMDWLAGSRTHLVEIFVTRSLVMLPLYLCGFSEAALNAYVILVGVQAVAIHANVNWNFGPLRYILATPQFHHWHHSQDEHYMDANYAVHLPVIDMLFGTYRCPANQWPGAYGIVSGEPPEGFWGQQAHPFRKSESNAASDA